jgi:hypothetical protein
MPGHLAPAQDRSCLSLRKMRSLHQRLKGGKRSEPFTDKSLYGWLLTARLRRSLIQHSLLHKLKRLSSRISLTACSAVLQLYAPGQGSTLARPDCQSLARPGLSVTLEGQLPLVTMIVELGVTEAMSYQQLQISKVKAIRRCRQCCHNSKKKVLSQHTAGQCHAVPPTRHIVLSQRLCCNSCWKCMLGGSDEGDGLPPPWPHSQYKIVCML